MLNHDNFYETVVGRFDTVMIIHDVLCNEIILIPFHPYDENSRRQQRVARLLFIFELI